VNEIGRATGRTENATSRVGYATDSTGATKDAAIASIRKDSAVSYNALASELGINRATVVRRIDTLKKASL
jgi:predicted ArsR family transcriptional regulator